MAWQKEKKICFTTANEPEEVLQNNDKKGCKSEVYLKNKSNIDKRLRKKKCK